MGQRIEWWFELQLSVTCDVSLAGQVIGSEVDGHSVVVHFPVLVNPTDFALSSPPGATAPGLLPLNEEPSEDYWGVVVQSAGGVAKAFSLRRIVVTADVEGSEADVERFVAVIDRKMNGWWDIARSWIEVVTGQRLTPIGHPARRSSATPFWHTPTDGSKSSLISFRQVWQVGRFDPVPAASIDVVRACFQQAARSEELPIAWVLIRDARALDIVGQFRRAVIDAGSAAEIAMTTLIERALPAGLQPKLVKKMTYGTLGTMWDTLLASGYARQGQVNVRGELIDVRNAATHRGEGTPLSGAASEKAIKMAALLVEDAYPLPPSLPRQW